jgi:hypothetical protein
VWRLGFCDRTAPQDERQTPLRILYVALTDFLAAPTETGWVHTFHVPPKSRAAEGWLLVGAIAVMLALLSLAI